MTVKKFSVSAFYKRRTQPEKLLQTQINFAELAQRSLAVSVESGLAVTDPEYIKRLQALNKMVTDLIDAKVLYAKTASLLAGKMTSDEVLQAAVDRIATEPKSVIKKVVLHLQDLLEVTALARMDPEGHGQGSAAEDVFNLLSEPLEDDD